MSTIGKGSLSLRKKDVSNQKNLGVGVVKVVFAHKATGGESSINFTSLSAPTEMLSNGFVQPSPSTLSDLNVFFNRKNLTLESSLRGKLMDFLSYTVANNSQINFLGFTLEPGEIITGTIDPVVKNDLMVVDGEAIVATGSLAIGVTDFNVGTPFETNKYPTQQAGAVLVYRNGLLQARCDGNNLANDGNYTEVAVTGGLGTLIRFKQAPVNQEDAIMVVSNGVAFERPSGSMMATIETMGGQLDKMASVLSAVSGLESSYFQSAPNSIDLLTFGNTVIDHGTRISVLESDRSVGTYTPVSGWQTGIPGGSVRHIVPATYVQIGKHVHVTGYAFFRNDGSSVSISWTLPVTNGSLPISLGGSMIRSNEAGSASAGVLQKMVANIGTATTLTWTGSGMGIPSQDGWYNYSFAYTLA